MKNLKIELKWGVLFILAGLIWMIFEKAMGWHDVHLENHATYTLIFAPIAIALYVLALLDKKRNFYSGRMNYREGFFSGLWITLVVVLLTPFSQYISHEFISPEYFPNVIRLSVEKGMMSQEEAESYFNLKSYVQQSLIFAAFMGLITSAAVAFFVKSKS